jgi:hypothetical protein
MGGIGPHAWLRLHCGVILNTANRGGVEMKQLHYLSVPLPCNPRCKVNTSTVHCKSSAA